MFHPRGDWYDDLMVLPRRSPSSPSGAAAGSGDDYDSAFADEALSYIDGLYGTALRLTRRPQDAEDLVQDTYLKAFRASKQFERGTNLKAWLFTILHNTFRNKIRHDGRNPVDVNSETVEQAVDGTGDDQTPETLLTRATLDGDLQAALDALPDAFRQAVWLRDVEEFSYAEIAGIIGRGLHVVFAPLGFNWQICIALIPGLAAREVAVASLATVYALGGDEAGLQAVVASQWSLATALSLLAWYVFAPMCISTLATVRRETNSWRTVWIMAGYLFGLAYAASFATYQIARALS